MLVAAGGVICTGGGDDGFADPNIVSVCGNFVGHDICDDQSFKWNTKNVKCT